MDFIGKIISPDNTTVTDSIFLVSSLSFTEKFMLSFQSFLGGFLFSDY